MQNFPSVCHPNSPSPPRAHPGLFPLFLFLVSHRLVSRKPYNRCISQKFSGVTSLGTLLCGCLLCGAQLQMGIVKEMTHRRAGSGIYGHPGSPGTTMHKRVTSDVILHWIRVYICIFFANSVKLNPQAVFKLNISGLSTFRL